MKGPTDISVTSTALVCDECEYFDFVEYSARTFTACRAPGNNAECFRAIGVTKPNANQPTPAWCPFLKVVKP